MSDPFRIFKDDQGRQETLKILWPELYECLARLDEPQAAPVVRCAVGSCAPLQQGAGARAAGRLTQDGPPACAHHIRTMADRPGGWPLRRER